jgi:hypothetical protein
MEGGAYRNAEFMQSFEERGVDLEVTENRAASAKIRIADEGAER